MKHNPDDRRLEFDQTHDPVARTKREALTLNRAWFSHGERLTLFQRATFTLLSFLLLGFGMYILRDLIEAIRNRDMYGSALAFFLAIGLPLIVMGIFGLRNVLRFQKYEAKADKVH